MKRLGIILWRVLKVMPVIGYLFVIASIPIVLRRKGYVLGLLYVTLEILPLICLVKAAIELYTGDLIPDKGKTGPLSLSVENGPHLLCHFDRR